MTALNGHPITDRQQQTEVIVALYRQRRDEGKGPLTTLEELRDVNASQFEPSLSDDDLHADLAAAMRADGDAAAIEAALVHAAQSPPPTDQGNAERLALAHGDDLRFSVGAGWHTWDGRRYQRDTTGEIVRRQVATVRGIYAEAENSENEERRKAIAKHAVASEAEPRIRRAITLAQHLEQLVIHPDDLDADPYVLNTLNGIVDLRTGVLGPHERSRLCSKIAGADYDPSAIHPVFERFLSAVFDGDDELEGFVRRIAGLTLVGQVVEQRLFFLHGPGATGKSSLLAALKAALGEYAVAADFDTFIARRDTGGARSDLARLAGARMVIGVEVDDGQRLAEGALKQLTGGDTITARFLYGDYFEYTPRFTLWLAANRRPSVDANDDAMWRRITQLPFAHIVPPHKRDPAVLRTLTDDPDARAAVLAWAVRGCLEWQEHGLNVPASVAAYTDEYRQENDPLATWLADCCELAPKATEPVRVLRDSYEEWAQANGERAVSAKKFAAALRGHGLQDGKGTRGVRIWRGISLRGTSGTTDAIPENLPCAPAHEEVCRTAASPATRATFDEETLIARLEELA